jgi:leucyl aminopeptidase (aminopeptidase T)
MKNAQKARIQTTAGTDIVIGLKGRQPLVDDGDFRKPGRGGNLPCGEIFISPELRSSDGVIVFDGSITLDKTIIIKKPVKIVVKEGFVTKVEGGSEAKQLEAFLHDAKKRPFEMAEKGELISEKAREYSLNATNLGEFGIGSNPKAEIVGNVLEDEKVMGTAHFAIGSNYDQDALALIHSDGIVKNPTIEIDRRIIMKQGKFLL